MNTVSKILAELFMTVLLSLAITAKAQTAVGVPYVEHFDGYGTGMGVIPSQWNQVMSYDGTPSHIETPPLASSTGALMMLCGDDNDPNHFSILIGPEIDAATSSLNIRLNIFSPFLGAGIEIGVCDAAGNFDNNFTPVDTLNINASNSWESRFVSLSGYSGTGHRIAIRMKRSLQNGNSYYVFVDDFVVEKCGVHAFTSFNRSHNSVSFQWINHGNPQNLDMLVNSLSDISLPSRTIHNVTSPLFVDSLIPGNSYSFQIVPSCVGSSTALPYNTLELTTLLPPIVNLDYCEDFESSLSLPTGWQSASDNGVGSFASISSLESLSGSHSLRFQVSSNSPERTIVIPPIDSVDIRSLKISYSVRSSSPGLHVIVGVMQSPENPGSFLPVDTCTIVDRNVWTTRSTSFERYSGNGRWIALRLNDNGANNAHFLDNIQLSTCKATGVFFTDITSHSVNLRLDTVDGYYYGDSLFVSYRPSAVPEGFCQSLVLPVRGNTLSIVDGKLSFIIDNLQSATDYTFYVYGICDSTTQSCDLQRYSVTTTEAVPSLPFCMDFESPSSSLPPGWYFPIDNNRPTIASNGQTAHSGSHSLSFAVNSMVTLPLLEETDISQLSISFQAYSSHPYNLLEIGVISNPNDEASFTPLDTLFIQRSNWNLYSFSFSSYGGSAHYIAIRQRRYGSYPSNDFNAYVDDLVVGYCYVLKPSARQITSSRATICWDSLGPLYQGARVEIGPHGFGAGNGMSSNLITGNTFTIDTLSPSTVYDVYVHPICSNGDGLCLSQPLSFATNSQAWFSSLCFDFEDVGEYSLPQDWFKTIEYNGPWVISGRSHSGSKSLSFSTWVYTPMVTLPYLEDDNFDGLMMSFFASTYNNTSPVTLVVGLIEDITDPSSFHPIDSINLCHTDFRQFIVDFSSYNGPARNISILCFGNSSAYIDDISIGRCRVDSLAAYNVATTNFSLRWNSIPTPTSVNVECVSADDTLSFTDVHSPILIPGLTPSTEYSVSVTPNCIGANNSCHSFPLSVVTNQTPLLFGWCEDFEDMTNYLTPTSWTAFPSSLNIPRVYSVTAYSGSKSLMLQTVNATDTALIAFPTAETSLSGLTLSLYVRGVALGQSALFEVGFMSDVLNPSSFQPLDTLLLQNSFLRYVVHLDEVDASVRHLALRFRGGSDSYQYAYVDNISIERSAIANLHASNVTHQSVTLKWETLGQPVGAVVKCPLHNLSFHLPAGIDSLLVSELSPATNYTFFLWPETTDTLGLCTRDSITFRTGDQPFTIPFCYNFEDVASGSTPLYWRSVPGSRNASVSNQGFNSAKSLRIGSQKRNRSDDYYSQTETFPIEAIDVDSIFVDFDFSFNATGSGLVLSFGIRYENSDVTTFFEQINSNDFLSGWNHHHLPCPVNPGSLFRLVIKCNAPVYESYGNFYIDNLSISPSAVTQFRASDATGSSIRLSWQSSGTIDSVLVEYSTAQFEPGTASSFVLSRNDTVLHGLLPATTYYFHCQPFVSDNGLACYYLPATKRTLHPPVNIPYCDNFDSYPSGDYPNNWRHASSGDAIPLVTGLNHYSLSQSLLLKSKSGSSSITVFPSLQSIIGCGSYDSLYVDFWSFFTDPNTIVQAGYMTDAEDSSSFVPSGNGISPSQISVWERHVLPIHGFDYSTMIPALKISGSSPSFNSTYIDDVCLRSCIASGVTVSDIQQQSVTIDWDDYGIDTMFCEFGPLGFDDGTGTTVAMTSHPFVLSGLAPGQEYDFRFRSLCRCGGESVWFSASSGSAVLNVVTQPPGFDLPLCEDFEGASATMPTDWTSWSSMDNGYPIITDDINDHPSNSTPTAGWPGHSLAFYAPSGYTSMAILPPLPSGVDARDVLLSFVAFSTSAFSTSLSSGITVGVVSSPSNPLSFSPVAQVSLDDGINRWQSISVDMASYSGAGRYLAIQFQPSNAYMLYIDNLEVTTHSLIDTTPACFPVRTIGSSSLSLPICEDFEDLPVSQNSRAFPSSWTVLRRNSSHPEHPYANLNSNRRVLTFYAGLSSNSPLVLLPQLPQNETIGGKWVTLTMSSSYASATSLELGYLSDTLNPNSFHSIRSFSNSSNNLFQDFSYHIPANYSHRRIAFRVTFTSGNNNNRILYLDQFSLSSSPPPSAVSATPLSPTSALIAWNSPAPSTAYTVHYSNGESWSAVSSDSLRCILEGLDAGSEYHFYFATDDGEQFCRLYDFQTPTPLSTPYCEDFNGTPSGGIPEGWSRIGSTNNYPRVALNSGVDYSRALELQGNSGIAVLPFFGLDPSVPPSPFSVLRSLVIECSYRLSSGFDINRIEVGTLSNITNPATFVAFDTLSATANQWTTATLRTERINDSSACVIAFRKMNGSGAYYNALIDNVKVRSCRLPEVAACGATRILATLPDDTPPDYYLEYRQADHLQHDTILHVTTNPFLLSGLEPNTAYRVYTRCDSLASDCDSYVSMATGPMATLPYCQDFSGMGCCQGILPPLWSSYNSYASERNKYPSVYTPSCFYFSTHKDDSSFAILPDFDIDSINKLTLSFTATNCNIPLAPFIVGLLRNPDDINSFYPVDTITAPDDAAHRHSVSFSDCETMNRILCFKTVNRTTWTSRTKIIDDLYITDCPIPSVALCGATSVNIIRPAGQRQGFWMLYGPSSASPVDTLYIDADSTVIHGLATLTEYSFYALSSPDAPLCSPIIITTGMELPLPYCEDFSSYGFGNSILPTGWSQYSTSVYNQTHIQQAYENRPALYFYNMGYAIFPVPAVADLRRLSLRLSLYIEYCNYNSLVVGVMDNPTDVDSFTPLDTIWNTAHEYQTHLLSFAGYQGSASFIALKALIPQNNFNQYIAVDYLYLDTLMLPLVQLASAGSVRFLQPYDAPASSSTDYYVEYGPQGFQPGSSQSNLIHVSHNPFILTDLPLSQSFDFFIRSSPDPSSSCLPPSTLTTWPPLQLPFCDNFDTSSVGQLPPYMRTVLTPTNTAPLRSYTYASVQASSQVTFNNSAFSLDLFNNSNSNCYAILPEFNCPVNNLHLHFQFCAYNTISYYYENIILLVGVMDNPYDFNTFTPVDTISVNDNLWHHFHVSLSSYQGSGRFVAFRKIDKWVQENHAYIDNLLVEPCDIPDSLSLRLANHNTVILDSPFPTSTGFSVEYGPRGFAPGTGITLSVDSLPWSLTLSNDSSYDFYSFCSQPSNLSGDPLAVTSLCRDPLTITTLSPPLPVPYCFDTALSLSAPAGQSAILPLPDLDVDSLTPFVVTFSLSATPSNPLVQFGTLSDPFNPDSFVPLSAPLPVDNSPFTIHNSPFTILSFPFSVLRSPFSILAFRLQSSDAPSQISINNLSFSTCLAWNPHVSSITNESVTISWYQVGSPTINLQSSDDNSHFTIDSSQFSVLRSQFTSLSPLTNHTFHFSSHCPSSYPCNINIDTTFTVFTPHGADYCIDHTDLTAPNVTCFTGSFDNPRASIQRVDLGYSSPESRHTVHYDTSETDPRTLNQLRTVPPGHAASVRLGNWTAGANAESIEYAFYVDPASFDLINLKYAAVLQDPLHSPGRQPRFSLEILDSSHTLISPCALADFQADHSANSDWHVVGQSLLWKDWTTVGIDLSPYAYSTIYVRLTTYDCFEGEHFGYAYFTLDCALKNMHALSCGLTDSNTFTAPSGFNYRWYTSLSDATISTAPSIRVPSSNNLTYYCQCSFVDNPSCSFTLSAYAGSRFPLASAYSSPLSVDSSLLSVSPSCSSVPIQFFNTSSISADGINPLPDFEPCESAHWDFGNGTSSDLYNPVAIYTDTGTYFVTLVAAIADGSCTDTFQFPIHVVFPIPSSSISGPDSICAGDTVTITLTNATLLSTGFIPSPQQPINVSASTLLDTTTLTFTAHATTDFYCCILNDIGCLDTLWHHLTVLPSPHQCDSVFLCSSMFPWQWHDTTFLTPPTILNSQFSILNSTSFGCDSILSLHLTVVDCPDNVYTASCTLPPLNSQFSTLNPQFSCSGVHSMSTPMVADLDADGIAEIIACGTSPTNSWLGRNLLIFDGQTGLLKRTIYTNDYYLHGQCITIADADADGQAEIYLLEKAGYLHCYRIDSSHWANLTPVSHNFLLSVADIMGDGNPLLVCGSNIYNPSDGTLLFSKATPIDKGFGAPHGHSTFLLPYYMYALADIDGDGRLEYCAGNSVYSLNITNLSGTAGNSMTLLRQAETNAAIMNPDGQTFLLDFDLDGDLDICVLGVSHSVGNADALGAAVQTVNTYVWDGQTSQIVAYASADNAAATHRNYLPSLPAAGDLDGNDTPEILFSWNQVGLFRYTFDPSQPGNIRELPRLTSFPSIPSSATPSTSAPTIFDFNHDGKSEILYRSSDYLYILDGTTLDTLCTPIQVHSPCLAEYPVVADVDADGLAEILVALATSPSTSTNPQGSISVFRSATLADWSSARPVWNQWAYSSVLINQDLTIPQRPFHLATTFPNGRQPFNAFLRQMPYINPNGDAFTPAVDVQANDVSVSLSNDSVFVHISYSNSGNLILPPPYGITLYRNHYRGQRLWTDTVTQALTHSPNNTTTHTVAIPRHIICFLAINDTLLIALNDLGSGIAQHGGQHTECDTTNNTLLIAAPVFYSTGDTTVVACDSFTWWNTNYTNSTDAPTHTFVGGNAVGCDSTVTLHLTINPSNTGDTFAVACNSFTWIDGQTYTTSTETPTYTFVGGNAVECDSTVTLHLTVNHSSTGDTFAVACDSFIWWNTNYTNSTDSPTHTFVGGNAVECDSTVTLHLTVNHSSTGDTFAVACDSFTWWNTDYTNNTDSPTHTFVGGNAAGCDSTVTLHLTVNHSSTGDTFAVACNLFTWIDGQTYTTSTETPTYTFVGGNATGCDSTVTLHLTVNHSSIGDTFAVACDSFTWSDGQTYTSSTETPTYTFVGGNATGCDSTVTLHLTVNNSSIGDTFALACDSFTWIDGQTYTTSTETPTYTFVGGNAVGCDSTVTLHLTVNNSSTGDTFAVACDSFPWWNTDYTNSTDTPTHTFVGGNALGCDSTVTLHLTVNHSSTGDTFAVACDSFTWWNTNYTNSTDAPTYTFVGGNAVGCDSTVTLHLTVNHSSTGDTFAVACDSFTWIDGQTYTTSTETPTYTFAQGNAVGCDSTVTLHLSVNFSTVGVDVQNHCDSYTWIDSVTYTATTYSPQHIIPNTLGCDSTVTLHLSISYSSVGVEDTTACNSFVWHGTEYTVSTDTPTFTSTNAAGCDSVTTLHLTINPCSSTTITACDSYTWNGTTYTVSGVYDNGIDTLFLTINHSNTGDTFAVACDSFTWWNTNYINSTDAPTHTFAGGNAVGCDSTVTLHLTVNHSTYGDTTVVACDSFTWWNTDYTYSTDTPTHTFVDGNAAGCDSTVTLHLTVNHSSTGDTFAVACDSFTWIDGQTYTSSTETPTYTYVGGNAVGCDSTVTLHLTVNNSSTGDTFAVACDSFTWIDGRTYTTSTETPTYTFAQGNAVGCDSTVTLHLSVNYSTVGVDVQNHCDSYTWIDGVTYTATTYSPQHIIPNTSGCDSTVTLHLSISYSSVGVEDTTACNSFVWHGVEFTESTDTPTFTSTNAAGCDSVTTLHLTINPCSSTTITACDSYTWNGTAYTVSGVYDNGIDTLFLTINHSSTGDTFAVACDSFTWWNTDYTYSTDSPTHTFVGGNAVGCDSTVTLHLTVNHSTVGDTFAVACDSFTWWNTNYTNSTNTPTHTLVSGNAAGCDSVVTLHLTVNHSSAAVDIQTACNSFVWHGTEYTASTDTATFTSTNAAGCDSVTTLHLTINPCSSTTITACDSYTWKGMDYTTSGVYVDGIDTLYLTVNHSTFGDTFAVACDSFSWWNTDYTNSTDTPTHTFAGGNALRCDSTVTLHLTVNHSSTGDTTVVACDSFTWIDGQTYTSSTETPTYTFVGGNAAGCDSTVTLHLSVNYSTVGVDVQNHCDSYTWIDGVPYSATTYSPQHIIPNTSGCDSTVTLHLSISYSSVGVEDTTACNSFVWHGTEYTASTDTATFTSTNAAGCDSVTTLHLTINPCSSTTIAACDSYTWKGTDYTTSGVYVDGVDTLYLTVNHSTIGDTFAEACDSFTWWNTDYTNTTNTPTHTLPAANATGCDSTVTLHLTVNHSTTGVDVQTACNSFVWHGVEYTESTDTATFTSTNAAGCDSVITLHLTINSCSSTTITACDSYTWNGTTYTVSGVYDNGIDTLFLTINHSSAGDTFAVACDSFIWWNTNYTNTTSTPTHTLPAANATGCDSTVTLHLTVNYSSSAVDVQTACNSFVWHGVEFTESTDTATFTSTNAAGCDSVITLHLTINSCSSTTITACDSYTWNGTAYTVSGVYDNGIDTLFLTINHSSTGDTFAVACDSFTWWNTNYTNSTNVPTHTFVGGNAVGCDSTVTLHLTVNHSSTGDTTVSVCDSFTWIDGQTYTTSAETPTYTFVGGNAVGCDSTVTLHLTVNHSSAAVDIQTACNSFVWHGTEYTVSTDTPTFTSTNSAGCDSVTTLHLTINPCSSTTITACDSYTWKGTDYTTSGVYVDGIDTLYLTVNHSTIGDTFAVACDSSTWWNTDYTNSTNVPTHTFVGGNAVGCDSTVTLHLTVNHSTTGVDVQTACNSFVWHGVEYTESTDTATFTSTDAAGCDSVTTLHLTINPCSSTTITACDSYTWKGTDYTTSGVYVDGIDTLYLTVNHSTIGDTFAVACDSFTWWNTNYTNSTDAPTHIFVGGNAAGCDSVVTLHLTVNHSSAAVDVYTACDSLVWHGVTYTIGGDSIASYTTTNAAGCDSTVFLHLTVNHSSAAVDIQTACNSFVWHGVEYTESTDTATFTSTNAAGCDSVTTLHLTINPCSSTTITACDSYTWKGTDYTTSGVYVDGVDTLYLTINHSSTGDTTVVACDNYTWRNTNYTNSTDAPTHTFAAGNAVGCDSTVTLHLTVNHSSTGDTFAVACDSFTWWNTDYTNSTDTPILTLFGANAAGCDSTVTLHLTINHSSAAVDAQTACDSLLWHGHTYTIGGDNIASFTTMNAAGCDSLVSLTLIINSSSLLALADSFCMGTVYHFGDEEFSIAGIYDIHYSAANGCDSSIRLSLSMLPTPSVNIEYLTDCASGLHLLKANANVDYFTWSSSLDWPSHWGSPYNNSLAIAVDNPVVITLTADYLQHPTCPASDSILLQPIVMPQASMRVSPEFLTDDMRSINCLSLSKGHDRLLWFVNGDQYSSDNHFSFTADFWADSLAISLVAANLYCSDTAHKTIYSRRHSIFAPNAFSPDEPTNRTFSLVVNGVVEYQLNIYNRQGLLVFQSSIDGPPWDGTHNGIKLPQDSYVWIVYYRCVEDPLNWHVQKGTVTLIR